MSVKNDLEETRREVTGLLWTRRSRFGKVGVSVLGVVLGYLVFAFTWAAIDPVETTTATILDTTTTIEAAPTEETSEETFPSAAERCEAQFKGVDQYDIFVGSREGYLLALHNLQRDCPEVAKREGLDSSFLPKCGNDLTAENCTAYEGP